MNGRPDADPVRSRTETDGALFAAGAQVAGRNRLCIRPRARILQIAVVGSPWRVDWQRPAALRSDLVIADRDESSRDHPGL